MLSPSLGVESTGSEGRDIALVLEDYHVVTAPAIHQSLGWLVEYRPPHRHGGRDAQIRPFPSRLRASGTVTELHADDLRFTPDEVAILLNQVMGLALTTDDLATLEAHTEGWIAGLQLAALALHDHRDCAGFIRTFSGSNRYIVDYLTAEVFACQSAHIQTFLLQTSFLDRMCGALCDALLGTALPGDEPAATDEMQPSSVISTPRSPVLVIRRLCNHQRGRW